MNYKNLSNNALKDAFENHSCDGEDCAICAEYMRRFNTQREVELGITEDPRVDEEWEYYDT